MLLMSSAGVFAQKSKDQGTVFATQYNPRKALLTSSETQTFEVMMNSATGRSVTSIRAEVNSSYTSTNIAGLNSDYPIYAYMRSDSGELVLRTPAPKIYLYGAYLFSNIRGDFPCLQQVDLSGFAVAPGVAGLYGLFEDCGELISVTGFENFDIGECISMTGWFSGCSSLRSVDLSVLNWDHIEELIGLFNGSGVTYVKLGGTTMLGDITGSFYVRSSARLVTIDLTEADWRDVSNVSVGDFTRDNNVDYRFIFKSRDMIDGSAMATVVNSLISGGYAEKIYLEDAESFTYDLVQSGATDYLIITGFPVGRTFSEILVVPSSLKVEGIEVPVKIVENLNGLPSCVKRVELSEGIEEVGDDACINTMIEEVVIPSTIKRLGAGCFAANTSLSRIEFNAVCCDSLGGNEYSQCYSPFDEIDGDVDLIFGDTVEYIPSCLMPNYGDVESYSLRYLYIGRNVKGINYYMSSEDKYYDEEPVLGYCDFALNSSWFDLDWYAEDWSVEDDTWWFGKTESTTKNWGKLTIGPDVRYIGNDALPYSLLDGEEIGFETVEVLSCNRHMEGFTSFASYYDTYNLYVKDIISFVQMDCREFRGLGPLHGLSCLYCWVVDIDTGVGGYTTQITPDMLINHDSEEWDQVSDCYGIDPYDICRFGNHMFQGFDWGSTDAGYGNLNAKNVVEIGDYCFAGCDYLDDFSFYGGRLGSYAFASACGFCDVLISGKTSVGYGCFDGCEELVYLTLDGEVTLSPYVFNGCTGIESLQIFGTVSCVTGDYKYFRCAGSGARGIGLVFGSRATNIPAYLFYGGSTAAEKPKIKTINFQTGAMTEVNGNYNFRENTNIQSVSFSDSIISINDSAFRGCTSLTTVTFGKNITSVGVYAFEGCESLGSAVFKDTVDTFTLGTSAFWNCSSLAHVTLPSVTTSISNYCFNECSLLVDVVGLGNVTSVGSSAFSGCGSLISNDNYVGKIVLPKITTINTRAFGDCVSLECIELGSSMNRFGVRSFTGCTSLTDVYVYKTTAPTLGSSCFADCSALANIWVPNQTAVTAYQSASNWSSYSDKIKAMATTPNAGVAVDLVLPIVAGAVAFVGAIVCLAIFLPKKTKRRFIKR